MSVEQILYSKRKDFHRLTEHVALQVELGHALTVFETFLVDVFLPDIGIAEPEAGAMIFTCYSRWKVQPGSMQQLQNDLYNTCQIIVAAKRCNTHVFYCIEPAPVRHYASVSDVIRELCSASCLRIIETISWWMCNGEEAKVAEFVLQMNHEYERLAYLEGGQTADVLIYTFIQMYRSMNLSLSNQLRLLKLIVWLVTEQHQVGKMILV